MNDTEAVKDQIHNFLETLYDKVFSMTIGFLQITLCNISGSVLNVFAYHFFMKKSSVFNEVFKATAVVDVITCVTAWPVSVSYVTFRSPTFFSNRVLCIAWFSIWLIITRLSILLVAIMSILRAFRLICPLTTRPKIRTVKGFIVGAFLVVIGISVITHKHLMMAKFTKSNACCTARFSWLSALKGTPIIYIIWIMYIPLILIFVSFTISCSKLALEWRRTRMSYRARLISRKWFHSGITLIIFIGMCLIVNLPIFASTLQYCVWVKKQHFEANQGKTTKKIFEEYFKSKLSVEYIVYFMSYSFVHSYVLNSFCNPLIYIWRIRDFRLHILAQWTRLVGVFRTTPTPRRQELPRPVMRQPVPPFVSSTDQPDERSNNRQQELEENSGIGNENRRQAFEMNPFTRNECRLEVMQPSNNSEIYDDSLGPVYPGSIILPRSEIIFLPLGMRRVRRNKYRKTVIRNRAATM